MTKNKMIPPRLKQVMRSIINKAGISCGNPRDETFLNRFYRAKDTLIEKKKEYGGASMYWSVGDNDVDPPWKEVDNYLKMIEEVEHQLFEHEFLEG